MVNNPASSVVMRRWALAPMRDRFVELVDLLDLDMATAESALIEIVPLLGTEPFLVEAVSKILALLAPEVVPLSPAPARAFVLGDDVAADAAALAAMVNWFRTSVARARAALDEIAVAHTEVKITGAQALDRLLWFDSEGFKHFEGAAPKAI